MNPKNEPVRLAYVAAALVALLVRFGVPIPPESRELVTTLLDAGLLIVAGEIARRFTWGPVTVERIQAIAEKAAKGAAVLLLIVGLGFTASACSPAQTQQAVEAAKPNVARLADGVNEVAKRGSQVQGVTVETCNAAELVAAQHPDLAQAKELVAAIRARCKLAFDAFEHLRLAIDKTDQTVARFRVGQATLEQAFAAALDAKDAAAAADKIHRELATYLGSVK